MICVTEQFGTARKDGYIRRRCKVCGRKSPYLPAESELSMLCGELPKATGTCGSCIDGLLTGAENARYKLLEFLERAEEKCGEKHEIRSMIQRERRLIEIDNRLQNLCQTVRIMLGTPPES